METVTSKNQRSAGPTQFTVTPTDQQIQIENLGQDIFSAIEGNSASIFNKDWWYGRIMDWSMKNEHFKTQMFRFVDVLPYLTESSEVAKHLKEYFAEKGDQLPSIFSFGVGVGSLAPGLLAGTVRKNITQMAKMFITGETPAEALPVLKKARKNSLCFTIDLLGEAALSEKEALDYQSRYIDLIQDLVKDADNWKPNNLLDEDETGAIPKVNISVKLTSLYSQVDEKAWDHSIQKLKERIRPIFQLAKEHFVFVNIDMEQYRHKDLTLQVFKDMLMEPEFRDYPHWGIVIQAYLRDSYKDTLDLIEFAKVRGTSFTIRLVKGAYWDYETIWADQQRWPVPVYTNKRESDANYERCCRVLLENYPSLRVALGSHNVRSIAAGMIMAEQLGLDKRALEIQMLYGMADPIKRALIQKGYRVRDYATVGELIPGMAYLVRRLLENTSNESFLRSKFADNTSTERLLADPAVGLVPSSDEPPVREGEFYNEPLLDFAITQNREKLSASLAAFKPDSNKFPLVIGGKEVTTERMLESFDPSHPDELVGSVCVAGINEAEAAIQSAKEAFKTWRKTSVEERALLLERLADLMLRDRFELIALEIKEAGKLWTEADGDITEAIDFCRYYARQMRKLNQFHRLGHLAGEVNQYHYWPRGVAAVIAPWNFPLAILTGMTVASVVTGNTVVMKPAEQSSVIGAYLMKLLREAGCPNGVVNFIPGIGEEIGPYITEHKDINLIAFTGSRAVGLDILKKASDIQPGQTSVKHCIIEMGGKNAIIVDSDADLDEAVAGVVYSAFGFQGQKCSACSRVIVVNSIFDRFMERLVEAVKSLQVGPAENPESFVGPVIDKEAQQRILKIIHETKASTEVAFEGQTPDKGFFVPPTVFVNVDSLSSLAQEEIFGPVLAVIKAKDIDEALQVANGTCYALTGGVYSRSPANIEKVRWGFEVGNLYINRGITGAMVGRHAFGGFKMSGLGSKTGGPDYLLQFLEPRCVTENTMRRGFAPAD